MSQSFQKEEESQES